MPKAPVKAVENTKKAEAPTKNIKKAVESKKAKVSDNSTQNSAPSNQSNNKKKVVQKGKTQPKGKVATSRGLSQKSSNSKASM